MAYLHVRLVLLKGVIYQLCTVALFLGSCAETIQPPRLNIQILQVALQAVKAALSLQGLCPIQGSCMSAARDSWVTCKSI